MLLKEFILNIHTAIPLNIGHKLNIHQTHASSIYVLFPERCEGISKTAIK